MNALTKAFVVVVTILSVVLVALVIPFAARVQNYASEYDQLKKNYEARLAGATEAAAEVRSEIAKAGTDVEKLAVTNADLTAELGSATNEIKALQTKLDQAQLTLERNAAALQVAVTESQTKSNSLTELNTLINDQLATISTLSAQRNDLSQTLIDEKMKVRRLSENYNRIQEENKSLEQQLLEKTAQLKTALTELAVYVENAKQIVETTAEITPSVPIRGSVTQINQITEGITLVQVNVGTRDLVKEGMTFTVYRGDEYIGKIKIASVDTADSVGELTDGGGVQQGDAVKIGSR